MKKTILIAAVLVAMVSCNKTLIETPVSESDYGYINLGISADTEMIETKADGDDTREYSNIALNTYQIALYNSNDIPVWEDEWIMYNQDNIDNTDLWKVPAGNYSFDVKNMDAADANGTGANNKGQKLIGLKSKHQFEVKAGIDNEVTIKCEPINSCVTVAHNLSEAVFTNPVIKLTCGTAVYNSMVWGHLEANAVYCAPSTNVTYELVVTMAADSSIKRKYVNENPITTAIGTWTKIDFTSDTTDGAIKVTIQYTDQFGATQTVTNKIDPFEGTVVSE